MKRYTVACEDCGCAVDVDYVPASVAQALYEALVSLRSEPSVNNEVWRSVGAEDALSLADGEEQP